MSKISTLLICLLAFSALAQTPEDEPSEKIILSQPILADPGATEFRVTMALFDWERRVVEIRLREVLPTLTQDTVDENGVPIQRQVANYTGKEMILEYRGDEAIELINAVNKLDFSGENPSLHELIILKLQQDGKLGGGTIESE